MNTIQKELQLADKKMIEEVFYNGGTLAKLTRDNVAIVEAMVRNDSAYRKSSDVNAAPVVDKNGKSKYGGSSAYWMTRLKQALLDNDEKEYSYSEIITGAVKSVDRENSTHLNADKCGRDEVTKRLIDFDKDELISCLKYPEYKDFKLFKDIAKKTSAPKRARTNVSFASKFCHYACFYVFEGTEYQDNYSIWDSILKAVVPLYIEYYGKDARRYDLNEYKQYRQAIDDIRIASGIEISRNGLDHLLWYYHKGRL